MQFVFAWLMIYFFISMREATTKVPSPTPRVTHPYLFTQLAKEWVISQFENSLIQSPSFRYGITTGKHVWELSLPHVQSREPLQETP